MSSHSLHCQSVSNAFFSHGSPSQDQRPLFLLLQLLIPEVSCQVFISAIASEYIWNQTCKLIRPEKNLTLCKKNHFLFKNHQYIILQKTQTSLGCSSTCSSSWWRHFFCWGPRWPWPCAATPRSGGSPASNTSWSPNSFTQPCSYLKRLPTLPLQVGVYRKTNCILVNMAEWQLNYPNE